MVCFFFSLLFLLIDCETGTATQATTGAVRTATTSSASCNFILSEKELSQHAATSTIAVSSTSSSSVRSSTSSTVSSTTASSSSSSPSSPSSVSSSLVSSTSSPTS